MKFFFATQCQRCSKTGTGGGVQFKKGEEVYKFIHRGTSLYNKKKMAAASTTTTATVDLIDIRGIDKISLLKKLWLCSALLHPDATRYKTIRCTHDRIAEKTIAAGYIDYFVFYAIRCDLSGDFVDATQWNAMPGRRMNFREIVYELKRWPPDTGRAYARDLSTMLDNSFKA
jgi:hypothetical protein